ncbi:hypothetical protein ACQ4PT_012301 [Festuca glaucescens]
MQMDTDVRGSVCPCPSKSLHGVADGSRRVFRVADHASIELAGLPADGRPVHSRFLRSEFVNRAFIYDVPLPVSRLTLRLVNKTGYFLFMDPLLDANDGCALKEQRNTPFEENDYADALALYSKVFFLAH